MFDESAVREFTRERYQIGLESQYGLDTVPKKTMSTTLTALHTVSQNDDHGGCGILMGSFFPAAKGILYMGGEGNPLEGRLLFVPLPGYEKLDAEITKDGTTELEERIANYAAFLYAQSKEDGFVLIDRSSRQIIAARGYIIPSTPHVDLKGHTRHIAGEYAAKYLPQVARAFVLSEETNEITIFKGEEISIWQPGDEP